MSRVTKIVNEWDPMGLLPFAPKDEYEYEIMQIKELLKTHTHLTSKELAYKIYDIFVSSFEDIDCKLSVEECKRIAEKLLEE